VGGVTVWKFEVAAGDVVRVPMPAGARVLHVGTQRPRHLCVWAEVDGLAGLVERRFLVRGTGHPLPADRGPHLGTVIDGPFVWHVYEATGG
jgi:hypothetical protein